MNPVEIKEKIYWVGALDWSIRDFHGYDIEHGTTYNSFLLIDDKKVLFDTVKRGFKSQLMNNISDLIRPDEIDYIVLNHMETDHTGSLPFIIDLIKPEKVFCSKAAEPILRKHFHNLKINLETVSTGDTISLGKRSIKFIESRMLHWPDSMVSYIPEENLLISNDIFGQHWVTNGRFDDQVSFDELMYQTKKYYANIILPFGKLVLKFINTLQELDIKPDMLACDHGVIWRSHLTDVINAYKFWAEYKNIEKVVIIYDTMWKSTEKMAQAVERGVTMEGVPVKVMKVGSNTRADIITEVIDTRGVVIGSSTLNNNYLPALGDVLTYLKGLRPAKKIGAAFGSYGWGGEAVNQLNNEMNLMKWDVIDDGCRVKFVPDNDDLEQCIELGRKIARAVKRDSKQGFNS